MAEYLAPGVYVEEVDSGSKPIEGVGTAMPAFVGFAAGGEFNKAELITSWTQYCEVFGNAAGSPWRPQTYLSHAVYGYFLNGGGRCYVVRVPQQSDIPTGKASDPVPAQAKLGPIEIKALDAGPEGNDISVKVEKVGEAPLTERFRLVITKGDQTETIESPRRGGKDPLTAENVQTAVRTQSKLIHVVEVTQEAVVESAIQLAGGKSAELAAPINEELEANEFVGDETKRTGMGGFAAVDDITMLCCPDLMSGLYVRDPLKPKIRKVRKLNAETKKMEVVDAPTCPRCKGELDPAKLPVEKCPHCETYGEERVEKEDVKDRMTDLVAWQTGMLNHCELMHDRVAIVDAPPGLTPLEMKEYRKVTANFDSKYGALYYPWIQVMDPSTKAPTMVPPCGHMAGVWARNDVERGVHKAPANEVVRGVINLEYNISKGEQEVLNPEGINCIRDFPGRGRRVWGARTLSSDPSWRYLNIRRFFNYLEKSIERGTQWTVFEPNDYDLWQRVRRNISAFLRVHWQQGMIFGPTPEDAFFVKCDAETNPQESVELGRLICEIGIRPVYPAEFVIFRIGQWSGGSETSE
ncbi:MAG: phage tail sheath protein [Armatimonadetes bacterium]|jgi:phage tail sheath protein FI|nr:phage tail sheath protein [Armatimonadota bacterium]